MNYIAQTVFTSNDLQHYGVIGMKWRHHKAKKELSKKLGIKNPNKYVNFNNNSLTQNGKKAVEAHKTYKKYLKLEKEEGNRLFNSHPILKKNLVVMIK